MTDRAQQEIAHTISEWKERDRQLFVLVAACAYLGSLFLPWWEVRVIGDSRQPDYFIRSDGLGGTYSAINRLSDLCVVITVTILVVTATTLRSRDRRLPLARRQLAIALVIFTTLSVFELWRSTTDIFSAPDFYRDSHIGYGAYVAIGTSLLVLLSVLVLDADGVRGLLHSRRKNTTRDATRP